MSVVQATVPVEPLVISKVFVTPPHEDTYTDFRVGGLSVATVRPGFSVFRGEVTRDWSVYSQVISLDLPGVASSYATREEAESAAFDLGYSFIRELQAPVGE